MLHITRRRDATSNTLQLRPSPQSYNNSKQQSKRYKANTKTANSKATRAGVLMLPYRSITAGLFSSSSGSKTTPLRIYTRLTTLEHPLLSIFALHRASNRIRVSYGRCLPQAPSIELEFSGYHTPLKRLDSPNVSRAAPRMQQISGT